MTYELMGYGVKCITLPQGIPTTVIFMKYPLDSHHNIILFKHHTVII